MRNDDIFMNCQKVVLNIQDGNKDSKIQNDCKATKNKLVVSWHVFFFRVDIYTDY